jgi:hypothetical protein
MLIDAILVSTNTRMHTYSLSLSLCYLALPSSIYKALRRHNLDQSKYTFLRIQFSHFKGSTSMKIRSQVSYYYLDLYTDITTIYNHSKKGDIVFKEVIKIAELESLG